MDIQFSEIILVPSTRPPRRYQEQFLRLRAITDTLKKFVFTTITKELGCTKFFAVTEWNTLPVSVIHAGSVNDFKSRILVRRLNHVNVTPLFRSHPGPHGHLGTIIRPDPEIQSLKVSHNYLISHRLVCIIAHTPETTGIVWIHCYYLSVYLWEVDRSLFQKGKPDEHPPIFLGALKTFLGPIQNTWNDYKQKI